MPAKFRDEVQAKLNDAFKEEIRQHGSIEIAYGKMVVNYSYRLLDLYSYELTPRLLRSRRRCTIPVETDVSCKLLLVSMMLFFIILVSLF